MKSKRSAPLNPITIPIEGNIHANSFFCKNHPTYKIGTIIDRKDVLCKFIKNDTNNKHKHPKYSTLTNGCQSISL